MTDDDRLMMFIGAILGLVISVGPSSCVANHRWCSGYAQGSVKECTVSAWTCYCADELAEAEAGESP